MASSSYFGNPAQITLLRMPVSAESLHRKAVHNGGYRTRRERLLVTVCNLTPGTG